MNGETTQKRRLGVPDPELTSSSSKILKKISILQADITRLGVDAIVNAANTSLLGGGGVDGAIHRIAGPELLAACQSLGGCRTGEAKLTGGYGLPARFVIHTVGPVWHGGMHREAEMLANCYRSCFALARQHNLHTLAFPAISCGVYGFPVDRAVDIAMQETRVELESNDSIAELKFACFDEVVLASYQRAKRQFY